MCACIYGMCVCVLVWYMCEQYICVSVCRKGMCVWYMSVCGICGYLMCVLCLCVHVQ